MAPLSGGRGSAASSSDKMLSHTNFGERFSAKLYDPVPAIVKNEARRHIKLQRALIVLQNPESYLGESLSPQFFLRGSAKRASDSFAPMARVHVYSPNLASRLRRVDVTAPRRRDPPQCLVSVFRDPDGFFRFKNLAPTFVTLLNRECAQIFIRNDSPIGDSPRRGPAIEASNEGAAFRENPQARLPIQESPLEVRRC